VTRGGLSKLRVLSLAMELPRELAHIGEQHGLRVIDQRRDEWR